MHVNQIDGTEVFSTLGLGPSDVASILYESPWQDAYELWRLKTGRQEKPPQTDAMRFGTEMEAEAFECYLRSTGGKETQWVRQFAARHPSLAYFRGIADGWSAELMQGVEIKVPTSRHLLDEVERGEVPRNYLLQVAGEMDIFGVDTWDFFAYDAEKKHGDTIIVSFDQEFELGVTLREFWTKTATPCIEDFWAKVQADEWKFDGNTDIEESNEAWERACDERNNAMLRIRAAEADKNAADAALKRLMGRGKMCVCNGWLGQWKYYRQQNRVQISADNAEVVEKVYAALAPLRGQEGIRDVKTSIWPETFRFTLRRET